MRFAITNWALAARDLFFLPKRGMPLLALALLSGCGGAATLPSQSGTLANTAISAQPKTKPFNPFEKDAPAQYGREVIENPTMAEVLKTAGLPERAIGRPDAPVTVIKYASLTCPYCRKYQQTTFPQFKKRYIDTGKVRYILREFPIGFQSGAATIALRCIAPEKYFAAYDAFMKAQPKWVSQEVRREPIWKVARKFGLSRAKFDACYEDKALIANLKAVKDRGRKLGVIGTPNFFINNKLYKRVLTMTDFDRLIGGSVAAAVGPIKPQ